MATKSAKKSNQPSAASTPASSSVPHNVRPTSPLSPARVTRLQEKEELQHLNDRLAAYIDRVRQLETENTRLSVQVHTSEEEVKKETTTIKSLYENELSEARRILDEVAKEKARLEIDCGVIKADLQETTAKLQKKEKDLGAAEKNAAYHQSKYHEMQGRLNQVLAEQKKVDEENKELKSQLEAVSKQSEGTRRHLEEETLTRVDLENRLQSLKEELTFKQQLHESEISETRTRKQVEISEIDGQLQERYEQKLADTLLELRDQYETQMQLNRDEIESLFNGKIEDLNRLNEQHSQSNSAIREQLMQTKSRFSSVQSKLNELTVHNASLEARVREMEEQLADEQKDHLNLMAMRNAEMAKLRDEMAEQLKDYQDLMGIKVALDMEIAAYRGLLEGEEARFNLSARGTPTGGTPTGSRGVKRRRTALSRSEDVSARNFETNATATGDIEILEQDVDGKFVKLHNKGENDINIGGWQLLRKAGEQTTNYKFHRSVNVKSGADVTVWSSDAQVSHNPPTDYVMKTQRWVAGSNVTTRLLNHSGEEVASRNTYRNILSTSSLRSEGFRGGGEELYHQQGDPRSQDKCVLM